MAGGAGNASKGCVGFILADDLKFLVHGPEAEWLFELAMTATLSFFVLVGSRLPPKKCGYLSTSARIRRRFRHRRWKWLDGCIPLRWHVRDLGVHWDST